MRLKVFFHTFILFLNDFKRLGKNTPIHPIFRVIYRGKQVSRMWWSTSDFFTLYDAID
ncbi:hypothetical protein WBJ53_32615 (plasmid) [Spirosoma sp. SC4-14]|uniref:hypothetical protein n=1 Tax=Spirosoma sp. SC4-14 TaxID=3128900 RepID=UPI0030D3B112